MKGEFDDDEMLIVCMPADQPTPYTDNVRGTCTFCGSAVQHRPHMPAGCRLCCLKCFAERKEETDRLLVTKRTLAEVVLHELDGLRKRLEPIMERCCIEAFVTWGMQNGFQLAMVGERFICPTCEQVYEMKPDGENDPVWTKVERRESDDVLDQFNLREHSKRVH